MSIVSAYTELPPGEQIPDLDFENMAFGRFDSKTPSGIEVQWDKLPAEAAQVYLAWRPVVVAYWNEEEIEDGEDREDADGSNPVGRDEAVPAEPDLGAGEGGEGDGDVPAPGATEPEAVEGDSA